MKRVLVLPLLAVVGLFASPLTVPGGGEAFAQAAAKGLQVKELSAGTGAVATRYAKVEVHYTGWLLDGTKFDSSVDRGKPFSFTLGRGAVIKGWDQGVEGMKIGGKRELIIPPELGYGARGAGNAIPPNATLKFHVELLGVTPPPFANIGPQELKALADAGVKVVDLRRADEWAATGVIADSHKITAFDRSGNFLDGFAAAFRRIAGPDDKVVVVCQRGQRSALIANLFASRAGYRGIYNLVDGIDSWVAAGLPLAKK